MSLKSVARDISINAVALVAPIASFVLIAFNFALYERKWTEEEASKYVWPEMADNSTYWKHPVRNEGELHIDLQVRVIPFGESSIGAQMTPMDKTTDAEYFDVPLAVLVLSWIMLFWVGTMLAVQVLTMLLSYIPNLQDNSLFTFFEGFSRLDKATSLIDTSYDERGNDVCSIARLKYILLRVIYFFMGQGFFYIVSSTGIAVISWLTLSAFDGPCLEDVNGGCYDKLIKWEGIDIGSLLGMIALVFIGRFFGVLYSHVGSPKADLDGDQASTSGIIAKITLTALPSLMFIYYLTEAYTNIGEERRFPWLPIFVFALVMEIIHLFISSGLLVLGALPSLCGENITEPLASFLRRLVFSWRVFGTLYFAGGAMTIYMSTRLASNLYTNPFEHFSQSDVVQAHDPFYSGSIATTKKHSTAELATTFADDYAATKRAQFRTQKNLGAPHDSCHFIHKDEYDRTMMHSTNGLVVAFSGDGNVESKFNFTLNDHPRLYSCVQEHEHTIGSMCSASSGCTDISAPGLRGSIEVSSVGEQTVHQTVYGCDDDDTLVGVQRFVIYPHSKQNIAGVGCVQDKQEDTDQCGDEDHCMYNKTLRWGPLIYVSAVFLVELASGLMMSVLLSIFPDGEEARVVPGEEGQGAAGGDNGFLGFSTIKVV